MPYLEKRRRLYYAVFTVPEDARNAIGTFRLVKSTGTADPIQAQVRAYSLVAQWQVQIAKARGQQGDTKQALWDSLRQDFLDAPEGDEDGVVIDSIREAALRMPDQTEGSRLFKYATGQAQLLGPLVTSWREGLRIAQKSADQAHRDVQRRSAHFLTLEAISPKAVKAWTDALIAEKTTSTSLDRILGSCRSFWRYLKDADEVPTDAPDPFTGSFRLASKRAVKNKEDRQPFTASEVTRLYEAATERDELALSRLIKLGAYTGARIEELCSLTVRDCADGAFIIRASKTDAGVRTVPIHPALTALVKVMAESSTDGFLIPSTANGKYGVRSDPLSKRFGRLKESLGFGPDHVFHSIRKTVATLLEQEGVLEGVAADILGHKKQTMTYGLYSGGTSLEQKAQGLAKVRYPGSLGVA